MDDGVVAHDGNHHATVLSLGNRTASVFVCLAPEVLAATIEERADCDPGPVEIMPRFPIRDLVLERIAEVLPSF